MAGPLQLPPVSDASANSKPESLKERRAKLWAQERELFELRKDLTLDVPAVNEPSPQAPPVASPDAVVDKPMSLKERSDKLLAQKCELKKLCKELHLELPHAKLLEKQQRECEILHADLIALKDALAALPAEKFDAWWWAKRQYPFPQRQEVIENWVVEKPPPSRIVLPHPPDPIDNWVVEKPSVDDNSAVAEEGDQFSVEAHGSCASRPCALCREMARETSGHSAWGIPRPHRGRPWSFAPKLEHLPKKSHSVPVLENWVVERAGEPCKNEAPEGLGEERRIRSQFSNDALEHEMSDSDNTREHPSHHEDQARTKPSHPSRSSSSTYLEDLFPNQEREVRLVAEMKAAREKEQIFSRGVYVESRDQPFCIDVSTPSWQLLDAGVIASDELPRTRKKWRPQTATTPNRLPLEDWPDIPAAFYNEITPKLKVVVEAESHLRRQRERDLEIQEEAEARVAGAPLVAWSADPDEWVRALELKILDDLERSPSSWAWIRPEAVV